MNKADIKYMSDYEERQKVANAWTGCSTRTLERQLANLDHMIDIFKLRREVINDLLTTRLNMVDRKLASTGKDE